MQTQHHAVLAPLTTLGVGGEARTLITATSEEEIIDALRSADGQNATGQQSVSSHQNATDHGSFNEAGTRTLILGGGSNLVLPDTGFDGTVIRIASEGVEIPEPDASCGGVLVTVAAGHPWDDVVALTLDAGLKGLEALSGIPGSAGATPVQNVGAYGADVAQTIHSVRTWDRENQEIKTFVAVELEFAYRDSLLKRTTVNGSPRYVVLSVTFQLLRGEDSAPIRYAELARALGLEVGEKAPARIVREKVLELRAGKGMVYRADDLDSHSTGSFFTNPILPEEETSHLPEDAPRFADRPGYVKLSAAWLIDRSGFTKGYGLSDGREITGGRASLSTKHTLAISNRGDARAEDVLALARAVRDGVALKFGISLENEPLLIDQTL